MSAAGSEGNSLKVVVAALAGNLLIALSKFFAAFMSGSVATLAEAIHSVADTANQVLLIVGMRRAERPPTLLHPFGHAVESYFWPFMVSIGIFLLGGLFALYEGVHGLVGLASGHGAEAEHGARIWSYGVLGTSFAFESWSFSVAYREFKQMQGSRPFRVTLMQAKDPTIPVVLAEDTAALLGLAIALVAVGLSDLTGWPGWDAVGSFLIGILLALVAWFLAGRTHSLLLGEAITAEDDARIKALAKSVEGVNEVRQMLSYHLGPKTVILAMKIDFARGLDVSGIEGRINAIEKAIRKELPHMRYIFVEPDATYRLQLDESAPREP
jgi:cation diffusion facilitator family transporter